MNGLLNLVGLATGLALYAMLLVMVLKSRRDLATGSARSPVAFDALPLTTAVLGVLWNLCTLSAYALPRIGLAAPVALVAAVGFVALGFLPAVVVHSVVRGERGARLPAARVVLLALAYAVSAAAAILQAIELIAARPVPSAAAMQLLTWSFIGLVLPLTFVTRRQPGARRALWAASLAAFAVSALHLSQLHEVGNSWPVELVGHHASIPLAVAILYQDFPFALADLFLKRALLLTGLVGATFLGLTLGGVSHDGAPAHIGILAVAWVLTALAYPWLRRGVFWFVDAVVLARPDYRVLEGQMVQQLPTRERIEDVLDDVRDLLAPALSAAASEWLVSSDTDAAAVGALVETSARPSVDLTIPTSEPPTYVVRFQSLTGGRRVLSGDVLALSAIAVLAARRIDAIRLALERHENALREQEIATLAMETELRALRAQLNPHFLFNALTTIGHLIQTAPNRALSTLMRLTSLLRAVLRSEGPFTTLGREIDLIEAYLDIERARFEERLRVRIDVAAPLRDLRVPPLVLQPLVENAVKHGITPRRAGGELVITASIDASGDAGDRLCLRVADTGDGVSGVDLARRRKNGVGLNNVERRLACYYGDAASLPIASTPRRGTLVELRLPLEQPTVRQVRRIG